MKRLKQLGVAEKTCGALVCVWCARNRLRDPLHQGTMCDARTRGLELRQSVVLFRHGARTPLTDLPCLPEVIVSALVMAGKLYQRVYLPLSWMCARLVLEP